MLKGEHKILGVIWNVDADELVFNNEPIFQEALRTEPTKHSIVSIVSKIFDPLGILSPVVIVFQLFFQELCLSKVTWDEILGEDLQKKWRDLLSGLKTEELLRVPRYCLPTVRMGVKLIGFCDASIRAYTAVVYLQDQNQGCSLIASKTRVAPAQAQTIPRLELLGALLLLRLMLCIKESLSSIVSECKCFTDSSIVLHWIQGTDNNWKPFVQHRVMEIQEKVAGQHRNYCRGKDNPANLQSRGATLGELQKESVWLHGPMWLRGTESRVLELGASLPPECLEEL